MILVIVVETLDVAQLAAEGRSGEAAEHKNEGAAGGAFAQMEARGAIESYQADIRGGITYL